MNKMDDFLSTTGLSDLLKKKDEVVVKVKKPSRVLWVFAVIGIIVAVAAAAYGIYRYFTPDYLDDFEDDFDDEFEDDFFDDDDEEEEAIKETEE
ncbi:MAG: hypothetical protein ACK5ML_10435 [Lachnospiraceae bacterium]